MWFCSMLFQYSTDVMPLEGNSCLYQLAYVNSFSFSRFVKSCRTYMMTLREDLLCLNYNYLNSHYPDIPLKDDMHFIINIAEADFFALVDTGVRC